MLVSANTDQSSSAGSSSSASLSAYDSGSFVVLGLLADLMRHGVGNHFRLDALVELLQQARLRCEHATFCSMLVCNSACALTTLTIFFNSGA
jgi:hypothetical protein